MVKPLLVLVGGSLVVLGVAGVVAPGRLPVATLGLLLTLPPAVLTLVLADVVGRQAPGGGPAAVMAGAGLRMGWAVVAVSVLGPGAEKVGIPRQSLADWVCAFYLVTLALETAGLWGRLAPVGRPDKGPAA